MFRVEDFYGSGIGCRIFGFKLLGVVGFRV